MPRPESIEAAREWFRGDHRGGQTRLAGESTADMVKRWEEACVADLAALIEAREDAEREACAKVADDFAAKSHRLEWARCGAAVEISDMIRARGKEGKP